MLLLWFGNDKSINGYIMIKLDHNVIDITVDCRSHEDSIYVYGALWLRDENQSKSIVDCIKIDEIDHCCYVFIIKIYK